MKLHRIIPLVLTGVLPLSALDASPSAAVSTSVRPAAAIVHRPDFDRAKPVTILISIDGFRADYLRRGVSPNLDALAASGVSAAMRPSFPSKTFPNHYTVVTGLRPDHHGIVGNNMVDPARPDPKDAFSLGNARQALDPFWWNQGEPIWVTAEKQGVRTGTMFWPGSEVAIRDRRPSDWLRFDAAINDRQRIDTVIDWLRRPANNRPAFITLYFDEVDTAGHKFGPDAKETTDAIANVDRHIGALAREAAVLGQPINFVIVADHGMAAISDKQLIDLDRVLPREDYRLVTSGTYAGIDLVPGKEATALTALTLRSPDPHMKCWPKAKLPARFHYGSNPRVPAIICLADVGWEIVQGPPTEAKSGGDHGYDPASPEMAALFIANGPAFDRGKRIDAFDNVDIYPMLARLLGITPQPSDGTDRLTQSVMKRP